MKHRNHAIQFAVVYANNEMATFNAESAIVRAGNLLQDALILTKGFQSLEHSDRPRHYYGFDINNYYGVGIVTCLEWHARSRLADLLAYSPSRIKGEDVKKILSLNDIGKMIENNVQLPALIGAATKINGKADYLKTFEDIWEELDIGSPILVDLIKRAEQENTAGTSLHTLFEDRHALVHEIGHQNIGSYTQRDTWSCDVSISNIKMALSIMRLIEAEITKSSPEDFPNRLDETGYLIDRQALLNRKIERIEDSLSLKLNCYPKARDAWKQSEEAQLRFLDEAFVDVPKRYYDPSRTVREMLLEQRYLFLRAIEQELE